MTSGNSVPSARDPGPSQQGRPYLIYAVSPLCLRVISPEPIYQENGPQGLQDAAEAIGAQCSEDVPRQTTDAVQAIPCPSGTQDRPDEIQRILTSRLLSAAATAFSQWFLTMRRAIARERARQQLFREEHGLPKSARIPYERPVLTAVDESTAAKAEASIRSLLGSTVADYARDKFYSAISSGDMRAFKIRLLFIKVRDSAENAYIRDLVIEMLEEYISLAESMAGCIPDPSPRRLSKKEQKRKQDIASRKNISLKPPAIQDELDLEWGKCVDKYVDNLSTTGVTVTQPSTVTVTLDGRVKRLDGPVQYIEKSQISNLTKKNGKRVDNEDKRDIIKSNVTQKIYNILKKNGGSKDRYSNALGTVTVTPKHVHKSRVYNTVDEIMEDIEKGKIVPYGSTEEICADIKRGELNPLEAVLFTEALDRYLPAIGSLPKEDMDGPMVPEDAEDAEEGDNGVDLDEDDLEEEEDEDAMEGEEEDPYSEPAYASSRGRPSFSYNPRGFYGGEFSDDI